MLIGIIGKPSAGKSTFFKSITLADIPVASYPFTTIKPNEGVGFVRVKRIDVELGVISNPREGFCSGDFRYVPVKLIDVAGLVPGAHEGKGLGLQFLDDLRCADVLIHVVDVSGSTNEKGETIKSCDHDISKDIEFLEHEIEMWMYKILLKGWDRFARQVKQEKSKISHALAKQLSGLNISEGIIISAKDKLKLAEDPTNWSKEDLLNLTRCLREESKPIIIAANKADTKNANENIKKLKEKFPNHTIIPCSSISELALREANKKDLIQYSPGDSQFKSIGNLTEAQKKGIQFIQKNVLDIYGNTGVQQILDTSVFKILNQIAIFPGGVNKLSDQYGNILPDCFLLPKNSTALDFAFKIHTDLGKGFIRAIDVKTKRVVGKNHILKHRDIIEIISSK